HGPSRSALGSMVVAEGLSSLSLLVLHGSRDRGPILFPYACRRPLSCGGFRPIQSDWTVTLLSRARLSTDVLCRQTPAFRESCLFHRHDSRRTAFLLEVFRLPLCRGHVGNALHFTYQLSRRSLPTLLLLFSAACDHRRRGGHRHAL